MKKLSLIAALALGGLLACSTIAMAQDASANKDGKKGGKGGRMSIEQQMEQSAAAKVPVSIVFLIAPAWPLFPLLLWFGFAVFGLLASRRVSLTT